MKEEDLDGEDGLAVADEGEIDVAVVAVPVETALSIQDPKCTLQGDGDELSSLIRVTLCTSGKDLTLYVSLGGEWCTDIIDDGLRLTSDASGENSHP